MILLSIFKFYKNNMRKFLSVASGIALSVLLVYTFQMVVNSINTTAYTSNVEPRKYFSMIRPKDTYPDEYLINRIKAQPSVDKVLPFVYWTTAIQMTIGGGIGTDILQVKEKDMDLLMSIMKLKVIHGRKPIPGSHEIIMDNRVAANKHLKIGDMIGSWVSKEEYVHGSYKIVGLISGNSIVSFAPIEAAIIDYNMKFDYFYGGIILPKRGQLANVNKFLSTLPNNYEVITYDSCIKVINGLKDSISILTTGVSFMIMIIVSLFTGLMCYIFFYQRKNEFGLLWALGFTRQQVINKTILEISGINIIGFIAGILLSMGIGLLLNYGIYAPRGEMLYILSIDSLLKALSIPIFSILFSVIPIWRMLRKFDPIDIIEGVI
jgi:ABC-type lipoprotein release transport system permease subunit